MLDIIQHISDNVNLSVAKKIALLDDFCGQYSYQETIPDPADPEGPEIPNPQSKKSFANEKIEDYIKQTISAYRKKIAEQAATFEELILEET